jgi:hypothetical protein
MRLGKTTPYGQFYLGFVAQEFIDTQTFHDHNFHLTAGQDHTKSPEETGAVSLILRNTASEHDMPT